MKKRRIMALLLSCTLVASCLLSGCGQQEQEQTQKQESSVATSDSQAPSTEVVEELEPYTVTMWVVANESKDQDKVMEAVNARIQETLPNTTLELVRVTSSEYKDRWNKAMASGEKIDMGWSGYLNYAQADVENEVLLQVDDLLEEYGQGIIEAVGGWDILNMNRINGGIYHILSWQGLVGGRLALLMTKALAEVVPSGWLEEANEVFFANQDYSVEDKVAIMEKIEEALAVAKDKGICPEGLQKGDLADILKIGVVYNDSYRVFVTEKDGVFTVQSWFDNPVYKAFADIQRDFYLKGYYREDCLLLDKVNTTADHTIRVCEGVADNFAESIGAKYGTELEGCLMMPSNTLKTGFDTGVVFPKTGENPERTMQVLNLIYTDAELYRLLIYGIEGTHYVTNSNGTITRPASDQRDYRGMTNWYLGTCINGLAESVDKIGYYEGLKEVEKDAEIPQLLGFSFSASEAGVAAEQTNISAIIKEYDNSFFTENYESRYAEFCDKLKDVGMDAYMKAFKEALSKYVTENNLGTVAP